MSSIEIVFASPSRALGTLIALRDHDEAAYAIRHTDGTYQHLTSDGYDATEALPERVKSEREIAIAAHLARTLVKAAQ